MFGLYRVTIMHRLGLTPSHLHYKRVSETQYINQYCLFFNCSRTLYIIKRKYKGLCWTLWQKISRNLHSCSIAVRNMDVESFYVRYATLVFKFYLSVLARWNIRILYLYVFVHDGICILLHSKTETGCFFVVILIISL